MMKSNTSINFMPQRLLYAAIFAALFSIIGWIVPKIYYQYIDTTEYYALVQPVKVTQDVYKKCERTELFLERAVLQNLVVDVQNTLIRIRKDNTFEFIYTAQPILGVVLSPNDTAKGYGLLPLPCDLENGTYFWKGAVQYRLYERDRIYTYITEPFEVE